MPEPLTITGQPFLAYLDSWLGALPEKTLEEVTPIPGETAVLSVDLIKGFCSMGPLASPRVNDIVPANVALFKRAWGAASATLFSPRIRTNRTRSNSVPFRRIAFAAARNPKPWMKSAHCRSTLK